MADNVQASAAVGSGATFATDADDSGSPTIHYPKQKIVFGASDTFTPVTATVGLPVGDAGGSLTVDAPVGTPVFVRLSDGSAAITTLAVSAASLPLPSGAATAANQSTEIASLASIDGKMPALGQALAAASVPVVLTASQLTTLTPLATVAATQSGTWNIGTATTVTTVSTVTSLSQWAGNAIDTNSGNKSAGTLRVVIATDQVQLTNALKVDGSAVTQPVSGTVTANVLASAARGEYTVDTSGPVDGTVLVSGWDGTNVRRISTNTSGHVNVTEHAVTQSGTWTVTGAGGTFPVTDSGGSLTVDAPVGTPVFVRLSDGSAAITTLPVSLASVPTHAVTQSGTWNVGTVTTVTTVTTVSTVTAVSDAQVQGKAAHDSAVSGNPVLIGFEARTSDGTAVSNGDVVRPHASTQGKLVVLPGSIPDLTWNYAPPAGGLVTTGGVTAKAAAGAGVRNYVKSIQVINSHQTISTEVLVRDGAAGTVLHRGWAQAAGGGYAAVFDPPLRGTANTLIEIAEVTQTATAGVLVNLQGYTGAD